MVADQPQGPSDRLFLPAASWLDVRVPSTVGYLTTDPAPSLHLGLPSPYLTFIVSLRDPVVTGTTPEHAGSATAWRTDVLIGGLHHTPAYICQPRVQEGIQLAVHPLAAREVFGVPAAELTTLVTDGADVVGARALRLRERLGSTAAWPDRFAIMQDFLRRPGGLTKAPRAPRAEVAEAWAWLARRRGNGSMDDLATHVALSPRQLRTLFVREVGASPKAVSRLMRFTEATRQITAAVRGRQPRDLTQIALRAGFYDAAHLVRDFHQYTGLSPTGWIAAERRNIQAGGHRNGESLGHDNL